MRDYIRSENGKAAAKNLKKTMKKSLEDDPKPSHLAKKRGSSVVIQITRGVCMLNKKSEVDSANASGTQALTLCKNRNYLQVLNKKNTIKNNFFRLFVRKLDVFFR